MQHEEEVGTEDNLDPSGHANVDGADASDPADDALQVGLSHMAGRVYRKQILAKLEREDLHASAPRNTHDKLMADAKARAQALEGSGYQASCEEGRIAFKHL